MHLGIDPGKSGGVAFIDNGKVVEVLAMPLAGKEIDGAALAKLVKLHMPDLAAVEKCHSMPKQGVKSMFTFGTGYGIIQGVLQSLRVPYVLVRPQQWKSKVLAGTQKDKQAAIEYVTHRFPDTSLLRSSRCTVKHDGMADAVCIAVYAAGEGT